MTRINSAICPHLLTDEHLLAEHREIKRLPDAFLKSLTSGALSRIPAKFVLGPGHVTFFLNKQLFLYKRYINIYSECRHRGFNVENYETNWLNLKQQMQNLNCWNDYVPTLEERQLLAERITERILNSSKRYFRYKSNILDKANAIKLLKNYEHFRTRK